ncbi:unnamed protein product [Protopolystoma xenopodis]|uniref:Uncharacterized protein n=1 Tax=Protopolystoma xenopodis TaxID=117903 RepID=A0A448XK81_9PLAT|nr:unnamed protein product [Protopolystoma xenopodis]
MYADPPNVIRLPPTVSLSEQSFSNFSFESTRTDSGPWQQAVQWPTEPSLSKAAFTTSTNYYSPGAYGPLPEGQCTDSDNANEKKLVSSLKQPGERSEPKRVRYRHPLASTVNTAATLARRKMVKNAASLETKKA